jgi:hypothetical protein
MLNFLANAGLKVFLNGRGEVKKVAEVLEICLKDGGAKAKVLLKGETEPTAVSLNYKIYGSTLCVTNVKTSKEWLNGLADIFKERYARIDLSKHEGAMGIVKHLL